MVKRTGKKGLVKAAFDDKDVVVADVPVKICFIHGGDTIDEYEDVIDLEFTAQTQEGRTNLAKMHYLQSEKKLPTEEALLLIVGSSLKEAVINSKEGIL